MTKTRLILIAIASTLIILATACSAALDRGDDGAASSIPQGSAAQAEALLDSFNGDAEAPADEFGGERLESISDSLDGGPSANPQFQNVLDRKIIQSTSVAIEVEEVSGSFQEIIRITETAGGFVASSTFENRDEEQIADVTIRVPADQYQSVLARIRGMGTVTTESSDANDVTEEYTDLQARLRTLNATEQRYLELLGQADQINEILLVQDRLDVVRGQIEQVLGRINLLEHLTDLATITVHLRPETLIVEAADGNGGNLNPLEAASASWETSLDALRVVAAVALIVVVFSWWLVPPAALLALGARWLLGRRPRQVIDAPSP
ncbi:MAG: DUF4349 domain-containing protein [Chloroflexi bacterium]|nr:DUF4349 domain-containing protein [Chloroflexota bacterium]